MQSIGMFDKIKESEMNSMGSGGRKTLENAIACPGSEEIAQRVSGWFSSLFRYAIEHFHEIFHPQFHESTAIL